jgi:ribosomal protein S1
MQAVEDEVEEEASPEEESYVEEEGNLEEEAESGPSQPRTPLEELEVGTTIQGWVRRVYSWGAFLDFGAATDGLLHVSEISSRYIQDANEEISAGETYTCRIKAINLEKGQVALTKKGMRNIGRYTDMDPSEFIPGVVARIAPFGAFVTLEDGVDGLLHISQIQDGFVESVEDVLTIGEEVQVRVLSVEAANQKISLSMKELNDWGDDW